MKRLNKKGFTLIELMVVIAILVVIMGLALPNITSSIERSKQKQKESKMQLIVSEAELYFDRYSLKKNSDNGVYVRTLINTQSIPGIKVEDICTENDCCIMTNYDDYEEYILYKKGVYYLIDNGLNCQNARLNDD